MHRAYNRNIFKHGLIIVVGVLLAGHAAWASTAREHVADITLIPAFPGGDLGSAPVYAPEELTEAVFHVYLDNRRDDPDTAGYLDWRSRLLSVRYAVWLYRFDTTDLPDTTVMPSPTLVITPNNEGRFILAPPAIAPGKLYAWQVAATIDDENGSAVKLWSTPLYFRTAPAEAVLPGLMLDAHRQIAADLLLLEATQRREQAGLAATLRGLPLYANYPSASDIYFCTPTVRGECCPMPTSIGTGLSAAQLAALGSIMRQACGLQLRLGAGESISAELTNLGDSVYQLVNQWPGATRAPLSAKVSRLAAVAEQLGEAGEPLAPDEIHGLLDGLLVAVDDLAGTGTMQLPESYGRAFTNYAAVTAMRIQSIIEAEPQLVEILGEQEAQDWLQYFRSHQNELDRLAEDVGRGRLAKTQLIPIIEELHELRPPGAEVEIRYIAEQRCLVNLDSIKRLTPADTEQVLRLGTEVVRCHLLAIADYIWPQLTYN